MAIAFVAVAALAFWLIMVLVAAREPGRQRVWQAHGDATPTRTRELAAPETAADNEHSEADSCHAAREHRKAA